MSARRFGSALLLASGVVFLLVASGVLDVRVIWRGPEAKALDLFGGEDDAETPETTAQAFWKEETARTPVAPEGVPASFADLAERVSKGVVNIQTSKTVQSPELPRQFEEFFFGTPFGQMPREQTVPSLGSGFVISPDGYIVTNNHVIEEVDEIKVLFEDGRELDAEVVGRDPKTDIALIRVKAEDLFALPLGDSDSVRPGEWVVAIGNPFGLSHTVTAGIVSAKHRIIGQGTYDDFIQTDAAINPGNSGGPLIDLRGQVIGINTAINPRANTIGFAVPINMAKDILPQLRATGHVTRGWLGVVIQRITPELAEHLELDASKGALVSRVMPGGPADKAGIKRYDVIVEFAGKPVDEMNDLPRIVAGTPVGDEVDVVVLRDGKRVELSAEVGKMEEQAPVELAATPDAGAGAESYGLRVQNLTPDLASRLGVEEEGGVVVSGVAPGSPADAAGLRREDVILEVDKHAVANVSDLEKSLSEAKDGALLLIRRGDATVFVPLEPPKG
jgi:serine protease Do